MKISEIIDILNLIQSKHGDLDVANLDDGRLVSGTPQLSNTNHPYVDRNETEVEGKVVVMSSWNVHLEDGNTESFKEETW